VHDYGLATGETLSILTAGKQYELQLMLKSGKVDRVRVDMGEPILRAAAIPTTLPGDPPIDVPLEIGGRRLAVTCVSMGNPHCVTFVDEATDELVLGLGPKIEVEARFPKRTNVEFVQVLNRETVQQRTWERGSGETWACGSGACAVCVAGALTGRTERRITSKLLGGDLQLEWNEADNHVYMTGPAVEVFTGDWRG
jgi:diaminopimelate epimerase